MVRVGDTKCPKCGGELKYYNNRTRIVKKRYSVVEIRTIHRVICKRCGMLHNELPDDIESHKHYEKNIIIGVLEGFITPDTLGFEDYPSELTMKRWCKKYKSSYEKILEKEE